MEICSLYRCAVMQHQITAALVEAEQLPCCSVLLCKTATAITPMEFCSSYSCAMTHHQCTATLFLAKCYSHYPVLLCKNRLTVGLCHCNYTYGVLLFIQLCSDPTPVHYNAVSGKMKSLLPSAALQKHRFVSLQLHLWRFALHTAVQ